MADGLWLSPGIDNEICNSLPGGLQIACLPLPAPVSAVVFKTSLDLGYHKFDPKGTLPFIFPFIFMRNGVKICPCMVGLNSPPVNAFSMSVQ